MPKTVLVVEDDEDARATYGTALADRGYRVLTATQGAEGVHLARRHLPDLILLDVRMPVMDGWDSARYLKSDPKTRGIPIFAISAYGPDRDDLSGSGTKLFDCFLAKPMEPGDVVDEIEAWIGPPRTNLPPPSAPSPE